MTTKTTTTTTRTCGMCGGEIGNSGAVLIVKRETTTSETRAQVCLKCSEKVIGLIESTPATAGAGTQAKCEAKCSQCMKERAERECVQCGLCECWREECRERMKAVHEHGFHGHKHVPTFASVTASESMPTPTPTPQAPDDGRRGEDERRTKEEKKKSEWRGGSGGGGGESHIMTGAQVDIVSGWIGKGNVRWKILYRGSRDGFEAKEFHVRCDNRGPTCTVIQSTGGWIFGGFTASSWESPPGEVRDVAATGRELIFTMTNPHSIKPTAFRHKSKDRQKPGIRCSSTKGPIFGHFDVFVNDGANQEESIINFPSAFEDTTGKAKSLFTGKQSFVVAEIEVFSIAT